MPSLVRSDLPREPSSDIVTPSPLPSGPYPVYQQQHPYPSHLQPQQYHQQYHPQFQIPQYQHSFPTAHQRPQPQQQQQHFPRQLLPSQPIPSPTQSRRPNTQVSTQSYPTLQPNQASQSPPATTPPAPQQQQAPQSHSLPASGPAPPLLVPSNSSVPGGSNPRSASPVAPEYSPITPKVQPVLPVKPAFIPPPDNGGSFTFSMDDGQQPAPPAPAPAPASDSVPAAATASSPKADKPQNKDVNTAPQAVKSVPEAVYIPQPPNQPFSADDATDAIALRAAISTLQFQKKKAQDDMKTLERIKNMALEDPDRFRNELAAGRLKEQRHVMGSMQSILDSLDDGSDDDEVVFDLSGSGQRESASPAQHESATQALGSRASQSASPGSTQDSNMADSFTDEEKQSGKQAQPFPRIPGAQDVIRMPYVNWDKYGIVGEPLESMHAQQQKWPGTSGGSGHSRGREYAVAAPYSPFLDRIDAPPPGQTSSQSQTDGRKDSGAVSPGGHGA